MKRRWLPQWVSEFQDRHGKLRYRFRRKGFAQYSFKHAPGSEGFRQEYAACVEGLSAPPVSAGVDRPKVGSFDDLISRYYRSPDFLDPGERTQTVYRGVIERWRVKYGKALVRDLQTKHVQSMMAELLPHRTASGCSTGRGARPSPTPGWPRCWAATRPTWSGSRCSTRCC